MPAPAVTSKGPQQLWSRWTSVDQTATGRERRLPDANVVLLVNLDRDRLSFFDGPDLVVGHTVPGIAVALPRMVPLGLDRADQRHLLGVELRPGVARTVLGVPPGSLDGPLVALEELWGHTARRLYDQLRSCRSMDATWHLLDTALGQRGAAAPEPGLVRALARLGAGARVADVAERTGYTSSTFTRKVRAEAGLTPKQLSRLGRFEKVLTADPDREGGWATVAATTGYADQSHLGREFLSLTGLTPERYRRVAPAATRHVPAPR